MNPNDNSRYGGTDAPALPLITVATVTYNAQATLERTLRSVEEQDYPRIEHLIVDGCSADHTLSLVQRYVERNTATPGRHAIRCVNEPDDGLYDAMNKALQLAAGDYIVFLNAGDRLHATDTISRVAAAAEWVPGDAANPGIIYGETDIVDDGGRFLCHRRLRAPERLTWRSFRDGMLVCHQSFYVRTDLARSVRYDQRYRFSADFDWCVRLMRLMERRRIPFANTHAVLTDYLNEGMTTRNHRKSLLERFNIMAHHYGTFTAVTRHMWFVIRQILRR